MSMMKGTPLLLGIVLFILSACVGSVDPTTAPGLKGERSSSVVIPTMMPKLEEYLLEATKPAPTLEEPIMTEEIIPIDDTDPIVARARADLVNRLGVDPPAVILVYQKGVVWPDATLGCGKPGMDFTPVETTGFILEFIAGGIRYTYHTDAISRVVLCPPEEQRPDTIFIMP